MSYYGETYLEDNMEARVEVVLAVAVASNASSSPLSSSPMLHRSNFTGAKRKIGKAPIHTETLFWKWYNGVRHKVLRPILYKGDIIRGGQTTPLHKGRFCPTRRRNLQP